MERKGFDRNGMELLGLDQKETERKGIVQIRKDWNKLQKNNNKKKKRKGKRLDRKRTECFVTERIGTDRKGT